MKGNRPAGRDPAHRQLADRLIAALDNGLRTLLAPSPSVRAVPGGLGTDQALAKGERELSARLMRVNHSGEVNAQGLYQGQMLVAQEESVRALLTRAAAEETQHLAWTQRRLEELGGRPSLLDPMWYAGSFVLGAVSGLLGDRLNLGFLAETERQVESHLDRHLDRLPAADQRSRAILEQMKQDEAAHAIAARGQGAAELPHSVRAAMRVASRLMVESSFWI